MTAGRASRLAAACCFAMAAPAAAQEPRDLGAALDGLADRVSRLLNAEASRAEGPERMRVVFRPARTELSGLKIFCDALSDGLRLALHGQVAEWRRAHSHRYETMITDEREVTPTEVIPVWTWEREAESVRVDASVTLPGGRLVPVAAAAAIPLSALNAEQRQCLFTFRRDVRTVEAGREGSLHSEPTGDLERYERFFQAGEKFRVLGDLTSFDGGTWQVVMEEGMGGLRPLFTAELADDGDDAAFEEAQNSNTVAAYEAYLRDYPSGAHVSDAQRLLAAARAPAIGVGDVFRDCDHCPEMVVVPAGSFIMGSPSSEGGRYDDEGPQHRVRIGSPFAVGVYEVTFEEWDACVLSGGCGGYRPDDWGWGRGQRPVINVSWDDAQSYVAWLSRETGGSYRLLSESEWEYAARAGTTTRYWWGNDIGRNRANCNDCGSRWDSRSTALVGNFGANGFGLHDVHGNVWEWVEDCWNGSYAGAPGDGGAWESGNCSLRVLRGGSWSGIPRVLRSASRGRDDTGIRDNLSGFRVARTFTP